ncbi:MAG: hypothetical protein ACK5Q5_22160 [Planctomycetaceae bacterium]
MSDTTIPESRIYRHTTCSSETTVGETAFSVASNPLACMEQTQCSACGSLFPVAEFEWADTDESLPDYYARHSQNATDLQRLLCSKKVMMIVILLTATGVATATYFLVKQQPLAGRLFGTFGGFVIGAFVGMAIFLSVISGPITR